MDCLGAFNATVELHLEQPCDLAATATPALGDPRPERRPLHESSIWVQYKLGHYKRRKVAEVTPALGASARGATTALGASRGASSRGALTGCRTRPEADSAAVGNYSSLAVVPRGRGTTSGSNRPPRGALGHYQRNKISANGALWREVAGGRAKTPVGGRGDRLRWCYNRHVGCPEGDLCGFRHV